MYPIQTTGNKVYNRVETIFIYGIGAGLDYLSNTVYMYSPVSATFVYLTFKSFEDLIYFAPRLYHPTRCGRGDDIFFLVYLRN